MIRTPTTSFVKIMQKKQGVFKVFAQAFFQISFFQTCYGPDNTLHNLQNKYCIFTKIQIMQKKAIY